MNNVNPKGWHTYENGMLVVRLPSGQVKHVPIKRVGSNYLPRPIRRARGALARAKPLEDRALRYLHYWYPTSNVTYATALSTSLRDRANVELARAVCHALQYLLAP